MVEVSGVAASASKAAQALPWSLNDLLAYLLVGTVVLSVAVASLFGTGALFDALQTTPWLSATVAVFVGYPTGYLVYAIGRLLREVFLRLKKEPSPAPEELDFLRYDEAAAIYHLIVPRAQVEGKITIGHALSGSLLAEKYLPQVHRRLARVSSLFAFQVSMMGALVVIAVFSGAGSVLRVWGPIEGNPVGFVVAAVMSLVLLLPLEYLTRSQNHALHRGYFQVSLAVAAVVEHEREASSGPPSGRVAVTESSVRFPKPLR